MHFILRSMENLSRHDVLHFHDLHGFSRPDFSSRTPVDLRSFSLSKEVSKNISTRVRIAMNVLYTRLTVITNVKEVLLKELAVTFGNNSDKNSSRDEITNVNFFYDNVVHVEASAYAHCTTS